MHSKLKRKTTVLVYVTATRAKSGQQSVPDGSAERTKAKWSNGDVGRGECVCGGGGGGTVLKQHCHYQHDCTVSWAAMPPTHPHPLLFLKICLLPILFLLLGLFLRPE